MRFLIIFFCLFSNTAFARSKIHQKNEEIYQRYALVVKKYNESYRTKPRTVFTPVPTRPYARNQNFYKKDVCYDCQNAINTVQENTQESQSLQAMQNTAQENTKINNATQNEKARFTPEFLVTNLKVSGHNLTQDFFVMQYKNKIFISLKDFVSTLIFNIKEDINRNYFGSFIDESNSFFYNSTTRIAKINGYSFKINKDDIFTEDGNVYFSTTVFEKLFPLHVTFDMRNQEVQIESMEVLPVVKEILRKKRYSKFKKQENTTDAVNPQISKYDMLSMPFVDIVNNTNINYGAKTTNNTSLFANMHFLKTLMTITGNIDTANQTNSPNLRIKNTYQDLENPNTSHILKPRKVEIGDINSNNINGIVHSVNGMGFSVSNVSPTWRVDLNQLNVNGYSNPNWDIEFYLNNILYDISKVDSSGFYNFANVPLNAGQNTVKLVFYGPNGQRKETTKYINLDSTLVKKGAFYYDISSTQANNFLLGDGQNQSAQNDKIDILQLQYGLTNLQTVQFAMVSNSKSLSGKDKDQYLSAGINSFAFGVPLDVSYIDYNNNEGYAVSLKTTFDLKTVHFNAKYLLASEKFRSRALSGQIKKQYNINASHTMRLFSLYVRNSVTLEEILYKNTARIQNVTYSIGTRIFNINLNNNLIFRKTQAFADGNFLASYRLGAKLLFRTNLIYITNKDFFRSASATMNYTPTKFGFNTTIATDSIVHSINLGASYNSSFGIFAIDGNYNSNKRFGIRFSITSGIIPKNNMYISEKPIANTSAIKSRVFIDNNSNDIYDKGDEPIQNAQLRINNTLLQNKTDKNGRMFITPVNANSNLKITLNQASINDIYTVPKKERYNLIIPEAKIHSLNIPLSRTGMIEGFITLQTKDGKKNVSGANVYLVNFKGQIVAQTKSASDGYYFFDIVKYGKYKVIIDDKYVEKYIGSL